MKSTIKNIAIFASDSGTNALNICNFFSKNTAVNVSALVCNKAKATVIERLKPFNIELVLIRKANFEQPNSLIKKLENLQIELIVLAGFLWLIPPELIKAFKNRIINLHPALLPKYGGKGMYGVQVHQAVLLAKEKETGITIHYVNEIYDEGEIIFQATLNIAENESPETLAKKIHELEYAHFPKIIEQVLFGMN